VYFTGYHAQGGLLLRQTKELGLDITWMMGNASNNPKWSRSRASMRRRALITTEPLPERPGLSRSKAFVEAFTEAYDEPPASVWWLLAGEAFNVIAYAIQETESTDPAVLPSICTLILRTIPASAVRSSVSMRRATAWHDPRPVSDQRSRRDCVIFRTTQSRRITINYHHRRGRYLTAPCRVFTSSPVAQGRT